MLSLLLPVLLGACSDPPPPPPPPPPPKKEEAPVEEVKEEVPTGPTVRLPEWGDGTMELRRGETGSDGSEREFLLGVSWIGPNLDGKLVQQWILFQNDTVNARADDAPDENIDGVMAYSKQIPVWAEGSEARPYAKVQPFIRCDTEDDRTLCRPCDGLAFDPTQARVCWKDLPSFEAEIFDALGKRLGLTGDAVRAIPHEIITSLPYEHAPYSVDACRATAAADTEYSPSRNDRVLKDTKVIAFVHQGVRGENRVIRQVVAKAEAGYPHRGGLLVQANGFTPMMRGNDQVPGPYAINDWCEAVNGWCTQVSSGCELVEQVVVQGGSAAAVVPTDAVPAEAPAEGAPAEGAPAEGAPAEGAPAEGAPAAPAEGAPAAAAPPAGAPATPPASP